MAFHSKRKKETNVADLSFGTQKAQKNRRGKSTADVLLLLIFNSERLNVHSSQLTEYPVSVQR